MKEKKSDYEEYLDKYCRSRGIPREEAEQHYLVKEYHKVCEEREKEAAENGRRESYDCGSVPE
jgi:hypothetical protein